MTGAIPVSPSTLTGWDASWLPPYIASGVVGMRLAQAPFGGGTTMVNGFAGADPTDGVEGFARAPYALAFDAEIDGVRLSAAAEHVHLRSQAYDFATGELTTTWQYARDGVGAVIDSTAYASHDLPAVVVQDTTIRTDTATELAMAAGIGLVDVPGDLVSWELPPTGGPIEGVDGRLRWRSHGGLSTLGMAYATSFSGAEAFERTGSPRDQRGIFGTTYRCRARTGRTYRLRQLTALVPELSHRAPHLQAGRLAALAVQRGWPTLRAANREAWVDLWRGRIEVEADDDRWQAIVDATLFYLFTSVHPSALASTSLFGLSFWPGYHYYHGHVMWDIETFIVPPLTLLQPAAARTLLDYRIRHLPAARRNAALVGRRGALYPWESGPLLGEEVTPGARPPMQEHVGMDIALAMAGYLHATDDDAWAHQAWPVLQATAEFIESRVVRRRGRYRWLATVGPREHYVPVDDNAYVNMAATRALEEAIACARRVGVETPAAWQDIAARLAMPTAAGGWIKNHSRARLDEEQGGAPEAAAGLFPIGYRAAPATERATYEYAVRRQAPRFVGMPMLSALMPTFAARIGDRRAARRLLERGYGQFMQAPFHEIDEFPRDQDKPRASPMFANMGGFLLGLLYGHPNLRVGGPVRGWAQGAASLPAGWQRIRASRIWAGGRPHVSDAVHGRPTTILPWQRRP